MRRFIGFLLLAVVVALVGKGYIDSRSAPPRASTTPTTDYSNAAVERRAQSEIVSGLEITNYQWRRGGFDTVALLSFTLKSTLSFPVRDVVIGCEGAGNSGTRIATMVKTVYEIVPAKGSKRVNELNMGFIPDQTTGLGCKIMSAQRG